MKNSDFNRGLKNGVPIALGYLSVSFTFGIMAVAQGMTWWQAVIISMTVVTSAGQLAGIQVMAYPGQYIEMLISQLTINVRYSFMSISLSQRADDTFRGKLRWLLGFFITDEIFALASAEKELSPRYFFGLSVLPYAGWALGTCLGALLGNVLPDIIMNALCLAMYGMFVAIVAPEVRKEHKLLQVVAVAAVLMCICYYALPMLSTGLAISICAVAAAALGAWLYPVKEESDA